MAIEGFEFHSEHQTFRLQHVAKQWASTVVALYWKKKTKKGMRRSILTSRTD